MLVAGEKTPYERGYDHAMSNAGSIRFPNSSDGWDYRLFHRGWSKGIDEKIAKRNQSQ